MIRAVHLLTSSFQDPIVFVDFKDSFTYNILSYLKIWSSVKVISPEDADPYLEKERVRFIWGPGPGRANEYGINFEKLTKSLNNQNHRHFGICLGHQLIGLCFGGTYRNLYAPLHGVSLNLQLPDWNDWGLKSQEIRAQFYNSLVIDLNENEKLRVHKVENDVMMIATQTVITCQFHPESVGTSCPEQLFSGIIQNFL